MENILQVKDLKKVFHQHGKRDVTAVENMSFSLRAGEILGIVGESGSGKSTVAKLITRLEAVTEGQIILDGQDITEAFPKRRSEKKQRTCWNSVAWRLLTWTDIPIRSAEVSARWLPLPEHWR